METPKIENINRFLKKTTGDIKKAEGIVIHSSHEYNYRNIEEVLKDIEKKNTTENGYGYHYVLTQNKSYKLCPDHKAINNIGKSLNYIGNNVFGGKPNEKLISILLVILDNEDYEKTEKSFVYEIQRLLKANKLYTDNVWRAFDIAQDMPSPLHMLNLDIFKSYIGELNKFVPPPITGSEATEDSQTFNYVKDVEYPSISSVDFKSPFKKLADDKDVTINGYVTSIYYDNKGKEKEYAAKFKAWDKGLEAAKKPSSTGEVHTKDLKTENNLQYTITNYPPSGSCGCARDFDSLDGTLNTRDTMVEPIYPDLITPPGANITIANGTSESAVPSSSNATLTPEEFENRQKRFSFDNFDEVKKETIGRPINCDDDFPVDEQIKKLEEHFPKVKIDKIRFKVEDTNHDGSFIGKALANNNAMIYDILSDISRRTEQRLVKIENNLSTVMRNLFRMSSRVNINCVYYGGQSVYGKKILNCF